MLVRALALLTLALGTLVSPVVARADLDRACDAPPCSQDEIKAYQHRVQKHLLRAQRLRFEADARGDTKARKHYDREWHRAQDRRVEADRALAN
jgi:hypothetical protein